MILCGSAWKFGNDLGATDLVAAKYDKLGMSGQWQECARHVLEDIDPAIAPAITQGDLLVAGEGFGKGHAHYYTAAIQGARAAGFAGFLSESIGGLFQRAAIDFGVPAWSIPGIAGLVETGDVLELDLAAGLASNRTSGQTIVFAGLSTLVLDILTAGGSKNWALRRVGAEHAIA